MPRPVPNWILTPGGQRPGLIQIDRRFFNDLANVIRDNNASVVKFTAGLDVFTRSLAYLAQSYAQEMSAGPRQTRAGYSSALSFRIPVGVWSGRYLAGWEIVRMGMADWKVRNRSPEAYLIEEGINPWAAHPVPRRLTKFAVLKTLRFVSTTQMAEHFLDAVLAPRKNARGQFQSFGTRAFGAGQRFGMAGPTGALPR